MAAEAVYIVDLRRPRWLVFFVRAMLDVAREAFAPVWWPLRWLAYPTALACGVYVYAGTFWRGR
jgi:hypothetical protein